MRSHLLFLVSVWAAVSASSACSHGELGPLGSEAEPSGPGGDGGVGPSEGGGPGTDGGTIYSGRYELTSIVDLAGANAFGDTISTTLVELSQFHDHPAATILDLMALYDVPYFSQVWDILPGFLKDPVTDLLDELIVDTLFDEIPAIDRAAELIADVGLASRNVELTTEMTLVGPERGTTVLRGQHVMKGLGFHLWGLHAEIPVPDVFQQITQLEVRAGISEKNGPPGSPRALLSISRQNFAIPYGAMIMDALKRMVFEPDGAEDLAGWLNIIIDCAAIADDVGNLCVLGECVKDVVSIDDMRGFCTSGLDVVGLVVENHVRSLKIQLADLTNGQCSLYDVGYADKRGDGRIDALADGAWDMSIHIGGEAHTVKSPFEGRRIADR